MAGRRVGHRRRFVAVVGGGVYCAGVDRLFFVFVLCFRGAVQRAFPADRNLLYLDMEGIVNPHEPYDQKHKRLMYAVLVYPCIIIAMGAAVSRFEWFTITQKVFHIWLSNAYVAYIFILKPRWLFCGFGGDCLVHLHSGTATWSNKVGDFVVNLFVRMHPMAIVAGSLLIWLAVLWFLTSEKSLAAILETRGKLVILPFVTNFALFVLLEASLIQLEKYHVSKTN